MKQASGPQAGVSETGTGIVADRARVLVIVRMGWMLRTVTLVATLGLACSPSTQAATHSTADDPSVELTLPSDPRITALPFDALSCTERVALPRAEAIDNVFDARWADDSNTIAISRIVTIPNARTITGAEEDQRISLLDLVTGSMRDIGKGSKPSWPTSRTGARVKITCS